MRKHRSIVMLALFAVVVAASATITFGDAATAITEGQNLKYVKHVNNLPDGLTTLWARAFGPVGSQTAARIIFKARADDGSTVENTIYTSFKAGQEKKLEVRWKKRITDLNFIQLIPIRTTGPNGGGGGGGNGCAVGSNGLVTICHRRGPNQPPLTIQVNANALPGHLGHGDSCGPCPR